MMPTHKTPENESGLMHHHDSNCINNVCQSVCTKMSVYQTSKGDAERIPTAAFINNFQTEKNNLLSLLISHLELFNNHHGCSRTVKRLFSFLSNMLFDASQILQMEGNLTNREHSENGSNAYLPLE